MAAIMDHYLRQLQDASGSGSGSGEDAPQATSGVALIQTLLIIIVFLLMMGLGATVTVADFKQTLKTPKGPIAGLLSQFGVMPLVAYLFAKALGVSNATGLSMVLIGCTPGGSTSNLFSYFARGDVPLSITMTVISNGFALFMMPLLVELYKQDFTTDEIDVPVRDIILGMAIVLVPVSIGLTIKKFSDKWAWRVEKFGSVVGVMFIVLAMLYVSFDNQHIFDSDWEIWFAAIFVHFCASGCGYGLALVFGLPHRSARTVSLETGIQNTTLTIAIVTLAFPDEPLLSQMLRFPLFYSFWLIIDGIILTFVFLYTSRHERVEGQDQVEAGMARTRERLVAKLDLKDLPAGAHPGKEHVSAIVEASNKYAWSGYTPTLPEEGGVCVAQAAINFLIVLIGICVAFTRDPDDVPVGVQVVIALCFFLVPTLWYGIKWHKISQRTVPEKKRRAFAVEPPKDKETAPMRNIITPQLVSTFDDEVATIPQMFARSARLFKDQPCMGTRELKGWVKEEFKGKMVPKKNLGDFEWATYGEVHDRIMRIGAGIVSLGAEKGTNVAIYADTKAAWQICAQACFAHSLPLVTVYSTLGLPALAHAIAETDSAYVIADEHLLEHLVEVMNGIEFTDGDETHTIDVACMKHVVYIEMPGNDDADKKTKAAAAIAALTKRAEEHGGPIAVTTLTAVEAAGEKRGVFGEDYAPAPDDMGVIMYTSGSTGLPKGVMMSHRNLLAGVSGLTYVVWGYGPDDVYLAYLPLAHVLELAAENVAFAVGARVGYGTPFTLTDLSPQTSSTSRGDAPLLRPTLMAAVPKVMDVIRGNILNGIKNGPAWIRYLFTKGYAEKLEAINKGFETPFWDRVVFDKLRAKVLGGRVRMMISGGGPLAGETQKFMNVCFCAPVGQGYGLTETVGAGTVTAPDDITVGRVGAPVPCCEIKLIDWDEGNYRSTDTPFPRGEVLIAGDNITMGYYKKPEKSAEVYIKDADGKTWFHTGDIGQWHEDGCLEIIDRRKDLVKLARGEYVSYGKVESTLRRVDIVENICVYADPFHEFCIAVVLPERLELVAWARESGSKHITGPGGDDVNWEALCADPAANAEVLRRIKALGKDALERFEVPGKIALLPGEWTPQNDLVTAALKLKRFNIYKSPDAAKAIADMYGAGESKV